MYSRVYVEITNICNMHCSFCHGHCRPPRKMTREEFSHILDQLSEQTQYIYYHLMGEPLLHPELPQFLQLAAQRGFRSIITTNGTLLKKRGDEILAAGLHKISISVHSFEEGSEESFLQYLQDVASFADTAANAGTIVVLRLWNRGCDGGKNDRILSFFRSHITGEWKENSRGFRIREKCYLEWGDRFEWPDPQAQYHAGNIFCYGMQDHFGILCDGTVVPCCLDSNGCIPLGNIFRENITDILAAPRAAAMVEGFRRRTASEELCRRCGYAQRFV